MRIPPFKLERYFAQHEFSTPYLLCSSDCESLTAGELLDMQPGARDELERLWLGYTESLGHPDLRADIAALYSWLDASQVLVHSGAEEAIFLTMNALLQPGDHVIVHSPCYQSLEEIPRSIGCKVTRWVGRAGEGWRLDLDELRRAIRPDGKTRVVIVNSPHNPTGYRMALDDWQELSRLSEQHGFVIFSDEVYRHLDYMPGAGLPAMCEINPRAVSLNVMSKSFGLAGLRIGWIATQNRELYKAVAALKDYTTICNSAPSEFLAGIALRHRERIIARNLAIIRSNLVYLDDFFALNCAWLEWQRPTAGPIAFPCLIDGTSAAAFCDAVRHAAGVLLLPGELYGADNANHFRIGFGRVNMPEALARLEKALPQVLSA